MLSLLDRAVEAVAPRKTGQAAVCHLKLVNCMGCVGGALGVNRHWRARQGVWLCFDGPRKYTKVNLYKCGSCSR